MERPVIAGVGMTRFGKHLEIGLKALGREAVLAAIENAGISPEAIEAAYVGNAMAGLVTGQECIRGQVVLRSAGTNCEGETARAFELAGATAELAHLNALAGDPARYADVARTHQRILDGDLSEVHDLDAEVEVDEAAAAASPIGLGIMGRYAMGPDPASVFTIREDGVKYKLMSRPDADGRLGGISHRPEVHGSAVFSGVARMAEDAAANVAKLMSMEDGVSVQPADTETADGNEAEAGAVRVEQALLQVARVATAEAARAAAAED